MLRNHRPQRLPRARAAPGRARERRMLPIGRRPGQRLELRRGRPDARGPAAHGASGSGSPRVSPEERRRIAAAELTDRLFHTVKLKLLCPPRWRTLFLAAAKRLETQLGRLREAVYIAAALDDIEALRRLHQEAPPPLWAWWAYDLGIVARATSCCRPRQLEVLPVLYGVAYPGAQAAALAREAMDWRPYHGSPEDILERQRGEELLALVRRALEAFGEIDVEAVERMLDAPSAGPWKTSLAPAVGVNYSNSHGQYSGWRALHYAAAAVRARESAVPVAKMLLGARADPVLTDASGGTALHIAAACNHFALVEALLESGAPVETADLKGCTALIAAARARHAPVVRRLAKWALPENSSEDLFHADAEKHAQRFTFLKGVRLHEQVANGDTDRMKELVLVGDGQGADLADVNFPDSQGRRPLHTAVTHVSGDARAADVVRVLVAVRADLDARDFDGRTALHSGAQVQRAAVVRALLRLRAHPGLLDNAGRTPLMIAAAARGAVREPPKYDGALVNRPAGWNTIEEILHWSGKGDPPGPPARRGPDPEPEGPKRGRRRKASPSAPALRAESAFLSQAEVVRARADALAALGFDDQFIVNDNGLINRGDRLQLWQALFRSSSKDPYELLHPDQTRGPHMSTKRMQLIWKKFTGPMLRLDLQGLLTPRLGHLLHYVLVTLLGRRGPSFGLLAAASIGTGQKTLLDWAELEQALLSHRNLDTRVAEVQRLVFRGPLPKKTVWVGSTWARDDYPREASAVPWGALVFVDPDNAPRLHEGAIQKMRTGCLVEVLCDFTSDNDAPKVLKRGMRGRVREVDADGDATVKFEDFEVAQLIFREGFDGLKVEPSNEPEAFKGNVMQPFEALKLVAPPHTGSYPTPHRGEQLQLANRLFVDESTGLRTMVNDRLRFIGEQLLCPLLEEAAAALLGGPAVEKARQNQETLKYLVAQLGVGSRAGGAPAEECIQPFQQAWEKARKTASQALSAPMPEGFVDLTSFFDVLVSPSGVETRCPRGVAEQSSEMPPELVAWLLLRHSTRAFIELRQCGAVDCADDFNEIVVAIAAKSPLAFAEHFWRAVFFLLLWGRARHLQPFFLKELQERLPEGTVLRGPHLRPRQDYLLELDRKAEEEAKEQRRLEAARLAAEEADRRRRARVGMTAAELAALAEQEEKERERLERRQRSPKGSERSSPKGSLLGSPLSSPKSSPKTSPRAPGRSSRRGRLARLAHRSSTNRLSSSASLGSSSQTATVTGGGLAAVRALGAGHAPQDNGDRPVGAPSAGATPGAGADGLPSGLTDVLRAEVVCDDEATFLEAFDALLAPPKPPKLEEPSAEDGEESHGHTVSLRTARVRNEFLSNEVFTRAARVTLLGHFSVLPRGQGAFAVQQLVEVDLLLPTTQDAAWLAKTLQLGSAEAWEWDDEFESPGRGPRLN